jgi:hypothetical protein
MNLMVAGALIEHWNTEYIVAVKYHTSTTYSNLDKSNPQFQQPLQPFTLLEAFKHKLYSQRLLKEFVLWEVTIRYAFFWESPQYF